MHPRTYALTFVTLAIGFFLAVVGMNLIIDTQGVFGTGLLGEPLNPNIRYQRFVSYEAAAGRYDGLLFGSSRAFDLPEELSRRMNDAAVANFSVQFGMITDHLPVLEHILREKAARQQRLRAVFLLLDPDTIGDQPQTNRFLQTLLAPAVTGERPLRFWWRYLTAIQLETWRGEIIRAWKKAQASKDPDIAIAPDNLPTKRDDARGAVATAQRPVREPDLSRPEPTFDRITARPDYPRQLRLVQQFVALCKGYGVRLIVATSPLSREEAAKYDPNELMKVIDDVSRIVPVWDFTNSQWLADHPDVWTDSRHFRPELGAMMMARIFGDVASAAPNDFGRFRTPRIR